MVSLTPQPPGDCRNAVAQAEFGVSSMQHCLVWGHLVGSEERISAPSISAVTARAHLPHGSGDKGRDCSILSRFTQLRRSHLPNVVTASLSIS